MNICISGAAGRMGQAVAEAAKNLGHQIVSTIGSRDDVREQLIGAEVVIDFSFHTATKPLFAAAADLGIAVVCGTTGHSETERSQVIALARQTRTVWAENFSMGVNLLCYLTEKAAEILPQSFNAEIVEMHHRLKKDAPSGTALMLANAVLKPRGLDQSAFRHGRTGIAGERTEREIGIHALRGGDVKGDHTVIFADIGERVELTLKASSRALLASGAISAAEWILGKANGVYSMRDVLGLNPTPTP